MWIKWIEYGTQTPFVPDNSRNYLFNIIIHAAHTFYWPFLFLIYSAAISRTKCIHILVWWRLAAMQKRQRQWWSLCDKLETRTQSRHRILELCLAAMPVPTSQHDGLRYIYAACASVRPLFAHPTFICFFPRGIFVQNSVHWISWTICHNWLSSWLSTINSPGLLISKRMVEFFILSISSLLLVVFENIDFKNDIIVIQNTDKKDAIFVIFFAFFCT